ncbi:hypothetical protein MTR_7g077815 [Medicago truncatula]|uniref:Uncharacterized protein n=1 Tax=Medicago truncatula TaxID=3880 RepID=A0A072U130_MEDTR|nr:hypothetical protein MTR_7g077815 [Medicago truncatula]
MDIPLQKRRMENNSTIQILSGSCIVTNKKVTMFANSVRMQAPPKYNSDGKRTTWQAISETQTQCEVSGWNLDEGIQPSNISFSVELGLTDKTAVI